MCILKAAELLIDLLLWNRGEDVVLSFLYHAVKYSFLAMPVQGVA